MKFKVYTLNELATIRYGKNQDGVVCKNGTFPILGTGGLMGYASKSLYDKPSVLIGRKGSIRKVKYINVPFWTVDTLFYTEVNENIVYPHFLYYAMSLMDLSVYNEGTTIPSLRTETLNRLELFIPSLDEQKRILSILEPIDDKIELNNAINHNLQQQVYALYEQMFINTINNERHVCSAEQCFDISIGKTPPRKEPEWFTANRADNVVWVSISDMGNCGLFISDSSEYLTPAAVDKFNVVCVPDNTVILSFKLTVGRIAISDGYITTNEAIAHFKTKNKVINEYLYCYLKSYNYQTLGSTSSIATAVNSKIIKGMPFIVPTDEEITLFHDFAAPVFEKIKAYQRENAKLKELRDSLLPKLMSGEIDVSEVEI